MGNLTWFFILSLSVIVIAWAIRKVDPIILQIFIGLLATVLATSAFAILPEILSPSPSGEAGGAWTIILAATWLMYTVPMFLVSALIINYLKVGTKKP